MTGKITNLYVTRPFEQDPVRVEKLEIFLEGIRQDRHFGFTKIAGVREAKLVSKGTEVLNLRTITIVSTEELAKIAKELKEKDITSFDLEANIEISGINDLTKLGVGSIIKFPKNLLLFVTSENFPCVVAGGRVARRLQDKDLTWKFPKAGFHLRGITCMPFSSGIAKIGDEVEVIPPNNFN